MQVDDFSVAFLISPESQAAFLLVKLLVFLPPEHVDAGAEADADACVNGLILAVLVVGLDGYGFEL